MRRRLALGPSAFSWQKICFYLGDGGLIEYDNLCVTVVYPAVLLSPTRTVNFNIWPENVKVFEVSIRWMKWSFLSSSLFYSLKCCIHTNQDLKDACNIINKQNFDFLKPKT